MGIHTAKTPPLAPYSEELKDAQQVLYKLGYYGNHKPWADGRIDAEFIAAVKSFQKKHHLPSDGIIGPITDKALHKEFKNAYDRTHGEIKLDTPDQY